MADVKQMVEVVFTSLDTHAKKYPKLQKLIKKIPISGLRPAYVILAISAIFLLILYCICGLNAISNLVGFVYPLYMSFKALQTSTTDDDTQWLTYWVVYAFVQLIESLTNFLISVPGYFFFKMGFFVFCFHSKTQGAEVLYHTVIEPLLNKFEGKIDQTIDTTNKFADEVSSEIKNDIGKAKRKVLGD